MQLTEQFHLPDEYAGACDRLTTLVERHAGRLLTEEYWAESHIEGVDSHTGQAYTYIRDDEYAMFDGVAEYVCDILRAVNDAASRTAAVGYLPVYGTTCSCGAISPVDVSNR